MNSIEQHLSILERSRRPASTLSAFGEPCARNIGRFRFDEMPEEKFFMVGTHFGTPTRHSTVDP
jgi:hypothetical protein